MVLLKELKVEYEGKILSIQTISKVLGAALKFAAPRFIQLSKRFRKGSFYLFAYI